MLGDQRVLNSHSECYLPKPIMDTSTLFVNLFALLTLAVFAHDEAVRGARLCLVAAACAGIVPPFVDVLLALDNDEPKPREQLPACVLALILALPLAQVFVACAVLLGNALLLVPDNQTSTLAVVVNAVALGFVLELDNKVGALLAQQARHWKPPAHSESPPKAGLCPQPTGLYPQPTGRPGRPPARDACQAGAPAASAGNGAAWGHVYVSLLGLLLLAEPLLLPPGYAIAVTQPAAYSRDLTGAGSLTPNSNVTDNAWAYASINPRMAIKFLELDISTSGGSEAQKADLRTMRAFLAVSAPATLLVVLVLYGGSLPSTSSYWPHALLAGQSALLLMLHAAPWVDSFAFRGSEAVPYPMLRVGVPCAYVACWLGLFWLCPCWAATTPPPGDWAAHGDAASRTRLGIEC